MKVIIEVKGVNEFSGDHSQAIYYVLDKVAEVLSRVGVEAEQVTFHVDVAKALSVADSEPVLVDSPTIIVRPDEWNGTTGVLDRVLERQMAYALVNLVRMVDPSLVHQSIEIANSFSLGNCIYL